MFISQLCNTNIFKILPQMYCGTKRVCQKDMNSLRTGGIY